MFEILLAYARRKSSLAAEPRNHLLPEAAAFFAVRKSGVFAVLAVIGRRKEIVGVPRRAKKRTLLLFQFLEFRLQARQRFLISADGWGNSDVDFANTMEQVGDRGITIVGVKFIGKQAKFVVENKYTDQVLDMNKSVEGIETEVVGENAVDRIDAIKALAAIKLVMRKENKF